MNIKKDFTTNNYDEQQRTATLIWPEVTKLSSHKGRLAPSDWSIHSKQSLAIGPGVSQKGVLSCIYTLKPLLQISPPEMELSTRRI